MSPAGILLAGTNHGVFRLRNQQWEIVDARVMETPHKIRHVNKKHHVTYTTEYVPVPDGKVEDAVHGVAFSSGKWYAATEEGLYSADDPKFAWLGAVFYPESAEKGHESNAVRRSEIPILRGRGVRQYRLRKRADGSVRLSRPGENLAN